MCTLGECPGPDIGRYRSTRPKEEIKPANCDVARHEWSLCTSLPAWPSTARARTREEARSQDRRPSCFVVRFPEGFQSQKESVVIGFNFCREKEVCFFSRG